MPIGKVLGRGQVTLPREVRQQARIKPGDVLNIEVLGDGEIRATVLPNLGPRELRARYPITGPVDPATDRAEWQKRAAEDVIGSHDE